MGEAPVGKIRAVYQKLVESRFRCALSGRPLLPDNFSLDHIIPIADGGTDDVSNLQAVDSAVNKAKGTLSREDFIQLCRDVAEHSEPFETEDETLPAGGEAGPTYF